MASDLELAVEPIVLVYDRVASGSTNGAGGAFAANGKGTITHVSIPVEHLEELARVMGKTVYDRDRPRWVTS